MLAVRAHGITTGSTSLTKNQSNTYVASQILFWSVPSKPLLWTLVYQHPNKMNKIFLIIVICFLADTEGSIRTKRAVDGTEYCLERERMPGESSSYLCLPASRPSCCIPPAWNQLNSGSSGLDPCEAPIGFNQDPCQDESIGLSNSKICF